MKNQDYESAIMDTILRNRETPCYWKTSPLHGRRIKYLDELTIESACNRIVRDFKMSRKEWGNVKGILNGMFACR